MYNIKQYYIFHLPSGIKTIISDYIHSLLEVIYLTKLFINNLNFLSPLCDFLKRRIEKTLAY